MASIQPNNKVGVPTITQAEKRSPSSRTGSEKKGPKRPDLDLDDLFSDVKARPLTPLEKNPYADFNLDATEEFDNRLTNLEGEFKEWMATEASNLAEYSKTHADILEDIKSVLDVDGETLLDVVNSGKDKVTETTTKVSDLALEVDERKNGIAVENIKKIKLKKLRNKSNIKGLIVTTNI